MFFRHDLPLRFTGKWHLLNYKKNILHMITLLSHVGKHRSSLYQASALGPPHKCFTCHMYFCEHSIFECMISKINTFLHHSSPPYTTDHNIKFTSALVSSLTYLSHKFLWTCYFHTHMNTCVRFEKLCSIFQYSGIKSYKFLYCTGFFNSNPN